MTHLLPDLVLESAHRHPAAAALSARREALDYAGLAGELDTLSRALSACNLPRGARVGIWLDKRIETVTTMFARRP